MPVLIFSEAKQLIYNLGSWDKASTDLFESFRQYDESGSPQRIQVLKYLVLTYMLMGSEINPFDSQETKPLVFESQSVCFTNEGKSRN